LDIGLNRFDLLQRQRPQQRSDAHILSLTQQAEERMRRLGFLGILGDPLQQVVGCTIQQAAQALGTLETEPPEIGIRDPRRHIGRKTLFHQVTEGPLDTAGIEQSREIEFQHKSLPVYKIFSLLQKTEYLLIQSIWS